VGEVEPFIEWLRTTGTPEAHVEAHRHYAIELAKHPSLTAALRAEEEAGSPAKRIANLRQTAARLAEFEESKRSPPPVAARPRAPESVAPPVQAPAPSSRHVMSLPRKGCSCRSHQDIYLDTDFGSLASMIGGGIGIGMFFLIRFIGILGAAAIALGLAGLGGLATIISICFRCEGCRDPVTDLDADERALLRKGRALVTLITAGFVGGAIVCGSLWAYLVKQQMKQDYGTRHDRQQQPQEPTPEPPP
jgi:hypothetical protein